MLINPYSYSAAGPIDPSFNNVSLLLHFDGTNGSGVITDSSPRPKTITRTGLTPRTLTTTPAPKFGTASLNNTTGNGPITAPNGTDFNFASGDWTVEGWAYFATFGLNGTFITMGGNASGFWAPLQVQFINNSNLRCYMSSNGSSYDIVPGYGMNLDTSSGLNTWHHWHVTRLGNNIYMGARGGLGNTVAYSGSLPSPVTPIIIGGNYVDDPSGGWGYLDEIRITKGVARYGAGAYTVPTLPFPNS